MKEQEKCEVLENLLNRSGRKFTDAEIDRIGETFGDLMAQIFG